MRARGRRGWWWSAVVGLAVVAGCEGSVCDSGICLDEVRHTRWGVAPGSLNFLNDVDGDGAVDLVAASPANGTVSVVWGTAALISGVATTWTVAEEVAGLEVVDVDRDGRLDLVTAVPGADEVAVLRGVGGRRFVETRMATGDEPRGVIAAELQSGVRELVTVNVGDGTVSVLGVEGARTTVVGAQPRGLATGDLDGDGDFDVAVALAESHAVQVLEGDGRGGLTAGARHEVGAAPHAVVVADFDGDGVGDVATADTLGDTVSVVLADGRRQTWSVEPEPRRLVVVEREGERPAVAVLSVGTGSVQVLDVMTGERVFGTAGSAVTAIAAGDIDGAPGVEVIYADGSQIGALQLKGAGVRAERLWDGGTGGAKFAADIDGDGIDEVVVSRIKSYSQQVITVVRAGEVVQELELRLTSGVKFAGAADMSGDGLRDVLVAGPYGAVVLVQQADGSLVEASMMETERVSAWSLSVTQEGLAQVIASGKGWMKVFVGGDGALLEVFAEELPGEPWWISAVNQRFVFATRSNVWTRDGPDEWRRVALPIAGRIDALAIGDIYGRGEDDAVLCIGEEMLVFAELGGEGAPVYSRFGEHGCSEAVVTDFNGDGVRDVVVQRAEVGLSVVTAWLRQTGIWSAWSSRSLAGRPGRFAQLDVDGVADVVMGGQDELLTGWQLSLGPTLRDVPLRRFGTSGAEIGDVNGDGAPDVVLFGGSLAVGFGDGDAGFQPFVHASREEVLPQVEEVTDAVMVDVGSDGRAEVVAAGRSRSGWTKMMVVRFDDAGRAGVEPVVTMEETVADLAAGDFDEDGVRDVIAVTSSRLLMLPGAEGFVVKGTTSGVNYPQRVEVGDADGDGHLDALVAGGEGLTVFRGLGDGSLTPGQVWLEKVLPGDWALGDIDRNGRVDAVQARDVLKLWPGWAAARVLVGPASTTALVDLNGDGQLEVIAAGRGWEQADGRGVLHVGRSGGDLGLSFTSREMAMLEPQALVVRDFDADEAPDVAVMNSRGVTIVRQR